MKPTLLARWCFGFFLFGLATAAVVLAANANAIRIVGRNSIEIDAQPGRTYQLQSAAALSTQLQWQNVEAPRTVSSNSILSWGFAATNRQSFFRVSIIETNTNPTLSATEARVIADVIRPSEQTNLLLGLRWPERLQPGSVIEPAGQANTEIQQWPITAATDLFVIDRAPAQKLAHPFTYVLVDVGSGAMRTIESFYPPLVNGVGHLTTLAQRWSPAARFYPTNFASAPPLAESFAFDIPPPDDGVAAGIVTARDFTASSGTNETSTAHLTVNCTNVVRKKVAVVIASGADDEIQNDARDMSGLLTRLGFQVTDFNSSSNSLSTVITGIQSAIQGLGPCDKFFLYLSSHTQLVDDNNDGKPDNTPSRLDYGLGHTNKSQWNWVPGQRGGLAGILQALPAGKINLMMDTCYSEAFSVLMRARRAQVSPGTELNVFASSSPTNTSAGATELTLLLDYDNDESHSAYTSIILEKMIAAADANQIDKNGDGQLTIEEIEEAFLNAQFAAEDELSDAQKPHFDRFVGAVPIAVGDSFVAPPGQSITNKVAANDIVPTGTQFVLVSPPALHADLFSWNPQTGEMTLTGLMTITQTTFTYKLVAGPWETDPVTVTIRFDPRMNYAEEYLTSGPNTVRVPTLILDGLHYPIYQFRLANNPADVCKEPHWHSNGQVFQLDVINAPGRSDPNPPACGFGKIKEVQSGFFEVPKDVWQDFLIDHIPPL